MEVFPFTATVTSPLVAPMGTVTVNEVDEAFVTVATTPLNLTLFCDGIVLKPVPDKVTVEPIFPEVGERLLSVGPAGVSTVNINPVTLSSPTLTLTVPVVALTGTVTISCVAVALLTTALTPLNLTVFNAAVVLNPVPVSLTSVPVGPDEGLMPVTVSEEGCVTVNTGPVTSFPPVETFKAPVAADGGTVATSCLSVASVTVAVAPLKVTVLAGAVELKPVPVIVTRVPAGPCVGDREVMLRGMISS